MNKTNKDIVFKDFPVRKEVTSNGDLKQITNNDALEQALRIWISTQRGEKIRTVSGGILLPFIGKPLDRATAEKMENVLRLGIEQSFFPSITIISLRVIPNMDLNRWEVYLVGYNVELSVGINTMILVKNSY